MVRAGVSETHSLHYSALWFSFRINALWLLWLLWLAFALIVVLRMHVLFARDARPCLGILLMDKRLHHFVKGFALPRCSLLPHIMRSSHIRRFPPLPPRFNAVAFGDVLFLSGPCLSLTILSRKRLSILNPEGAGGSGCHFECLRSCCLFVVGVQSFVHQPLR